jgi:small-conductance mechanosensitive channel
MMVGDGESQPTEGAGTLDDIVNAMVGEEAVPAESESEESEEAEAVEAEEEGADDADEEEQEEEATFTIKVNGKDVTLKQSELVEMAQKGTDYSQKTMAVAEERKAVEAERTQAAQYRQQHEQALQETVTQLRALSGFMESQLGAPPDIALLHTQGSDVYLAHKEQYEHRRAQLQEAYQAIQSLEGEAQRKRQASIAERAESAEKVLRDTLPGWNDDMAHDLAAYAKGLGLTPQNTTEALLEPGFWQLAHKAKAYDALLAAKAKLKPVAQLPKVLKPSATNQPPQLARRQEAMKRHKSAPSLQSLADLL